MTVHGIGHCTFSELEMGTPSPGNVRGELPSYAAYGPLPCLSSATKSNGLIDEPGFRGVLAQSTWSDSSFSPAEQAFRPPVFGSTATNASRRFFGWPFITSRTVFSARLCAFLLIVV